MVRTLKDSFEKNSRAPTDRKKTENLFGSLSFFSTSSAFVDTNTFIID